MSITNVTPLLDGALYGDPRTARQQLVATMAEHIIAIDCVGNDCDAFRALMNSQRYDIAVAALCFAEAMYLAQQIVIAEEMGES